MVELLGTDREARLGAGTAQRLVSGDSGAPPAILAMPPHSSESFGLGRHALSLNVCV